MESKFHMAHDKCRPHTIQRTCAAVRIIDSTNELSLAFMLHLLYFVNTFYLSHNSWLGRHDPMVHVVYKIPLSHGTKWNYSNDNNSKTHIKMTSATTKAHTERILAFILCDYLLSVWVNGQIISPLCVQKQTDYKSDLTNRYTITLTEMVIRFCWTVHVRRD